MKKPNARVTKKRSFSFSVSLILSFHMMLWVISQRALKLVTADTSKAMFSSVLLIPYSVDKN